MIVFTVLLPYHLVIKTDFVHFMEHSFLDSDSVFIDWVFKYFCFRVQYYTFPLSPTGKKIHRNECSSCLNRAGYHAVRCIWELRGHRRHFTASGIRAWSSFWKIYLRRRLRNEKGGCDCIHKRTANSTYVYMYIHMSVCVNRYVDRDTHIDNWISSGLKESL